MTLPISLLCMSCLFAPLLHSAEDNALLPNHYDQLIKTLLNEDRYDKRVPPSYYDSNLTLHQPVVVTVDVTVYRILGIDEKIESVSAIISMTETWLDPRLKWDPKTYGNITDVTLEMNLVWIADTRISSIQTLNSEDQADKSHVSIEHTGKVYLSYLTLAEEICPLHLQYFPFDDQTCHFYVYTKASTTNLIKYKKAVSYDQCHLKSDLAELQDSEWVMVNCSIVDDGQEGTGKFGSELYIKFLVRRQYLYHIVNLLSPGAAIALMNTVGLFVNVDAETSEMDASSLGMTSLLALSVLLLTASDQIPKGSTSISMLGIFYIAIVLQTMVATFTSVYLRNNSHRAFVRQLIGRMVDGSLRKTGPEEQNDEGRPSRNVCSFGRFCLVVHVLFIIITTVAIILVGLAHRHQFLK